MIHQCDVNFEDKKSRNKPLKWPIPIWVNAKYNTYLWVVSLWRSINFLRQFFCSIRIFPSSLELNDCIAMLCVLPYYKIGIICYKNGHFFVEAVVLVKVFKPRAIDWPMRLSWIVTTLCSTTLGNALRLLFSHLGTLIDFRAVDYNTFPSWLYQFHRII